MRPLTKREWLIAAVGALLIAGVLSAGWLSVMLLDGNRPDPRVRAGWKLRNIGDAMHRWSNDHQEWAPAGAWKLEDLVTAGYLTAHDLHSPSDPRPSGVSYALMPRPARMASDEHASISSGTIVAYEILCDSRGTNVMFVDGHVDWMGRDEFLAAYRAHFDGFNLPYEPPTPCE